MVSRVIVSASFPGGSPAQACKNVSAAIVGGAVAARSGQTFTVSAPPASCSRTTHSSEFSEAHSSESSIRFAAPFPRRLAYFGSINSSSGLELSIITLIASPPSRIPSGPSSILEGFRDIVN